MKISSEPSALARLFLLVGVVLFIGAVNIVVDTMSKWFFSFSGNRPSPLGMIWFAVALYTFVR